MPVKTEEAQAAATVFCIREFLIRQRTQAIDALRGHPGKFGQIVLQGAANATRLIAIVEDPDSGLPVDAIATLKALIPVPNPLRDSSRESSVVAGMHEQTYTCDLQDECSAPDMGFPTKTWCRTYAKHACAKPSDDGQRP